MCAPTHFRVAYDINPWMTRNVGGATAQAHRQWERLVALLLDEGKASIELIEPPVKTTSSNRRPVFPISFLPQTPR